VAVHDITCREVVEVVTDFLEGRLPIEDRDLFERHIAMCAWCETYLDQMRHTVSVVGALREDDVPEPMLDALARVFTREQGAAPDG
jgi:exonuclease VII small subunit